MSERDANPADAQQQLLLDARLLVSATARLNSLLLRRYLRAEDDGELAAEIAHLRDILDGLQEFLNSQPAADAGPAIELPPATWGGDDERSIPGEPPVDDQTYLVLSAPDPEPADAPMPEEPSVAVSPVIEPPLMEPLVVGPPVSEPLVSEPLVSEPLVSEPLVSEPLVSEPLVSEPLVSEPVVSEPVVSEPVVSEPVTCPVCGAHPRPGARFCTTCGHRLPERPAVPPPPPPPAPVAAAAPAEQPTVPHTFRPATAPPPIVTYCTECGLGVTAGVTRCPNCGSLIKLP